MSHAATNWAIKQRGLRPAVKLVLWHLADRHNADTGRCDPSQSRLARDCEVSRASLNRHLADLESKGLIQRIQRTDPDTNRQQNTYYVLAFDTEFHSASEDAEPQDVEEPCLNLRQGAVSQNEPEPCLKMDESRVSICDTNPVREPGRRTSNTPLPPKFDDAWKIYPRKVGKGAARKAWAGAVRKVSAETIFTALQEFTPTTTGAETRFIPHLATWLNQERWDDDVGHASNSRTTDDELNSLMAPQLRIAK